MAISSNTEYAATIDEKWDSDVEKARYSKSMLMPRVLNKSGLVKKSGDIIDMTVNARLTVGSVNATTGVFTQRSLTPTAVQLTVDQMKECNLNTTNQALAQAFWTPESTFPTDAGAALAEAYDNYIATIGYQGVAAANVIGTEQNSNAITNAAIRSILARLADARVPIDERDNMTIAIRPSGLYVDLLGENDFTSALAIGGSAVTPLITGNVGFNVLGCKVCPTPEIAEVNGVYKSLVFHKSAIAFGLQKNHEFERYSLASAGVLGKGVVMFSLYGAKVLRSDHMFLINTAK